MISKERTMSNRWANFRARLARLSRNIRIGLWVVGLIVFIVFLLQNTQTIHVRLLFVDADVPIAIVILVIALGGFAIGYLSAVRAGRRQRRHAPPEKQG
jgi:uncharacterized integral membrane protein